MQRLAATKERWSFVHNGDNLIELIPDLHKNSQELTNITLDFYN
jgi:hypothetical protein